MTEPKLVLSEMSWVEAANALNQKPVGLLPVGAIEAHGPHLPLNTDVIIASATARKSANKLREIGVPALVLPPIHYSVSFAGTSFPGTSRVDEDALTVYLSSVLTHLTSQGYRAIILCNAHLEPAHVACVQATCSTVERATGIPVRSPDQRAAEYASRLTAEFQAGARHAGAYETSIVLAAQPSSVRAEIASGLSPVWIDLPARLRGGARTFAEAGANMGYFGDPARASAEEGHQMLDALAEMVLDECRKADLLWSADQD